MELLAIWALAVGLLIWIVAHTPYWTKFTYEDYMEMRKQKSCATCGRIIPPSCDFWRYKDKYFHDFCISRPRT